MLPPSKNLKRKSRKSRKKKRGIYLLPNLLTTGNLFCGFYGIVAAINHNFRTAAIAILFACLFDILDGKVARLTGSNSRFGMEYDSLADLVAFGVAFIYGRSNHSADWGGLQPSSLLLAALSALRGSMFRPVQFLRSISLDFPYLVLHSWSPPQYFSSIAWE